MQRMQGSSGASSPPQPGSTLHSPQIPAASASTSTGFSPNALAYNMPQLSPMMQMQMGIGMNIGLGGAPSYGAGAGGQQALHPQTQAMHQSVMRHPSPRPQQPQEGQGQGQQGGYGAF